VADRLKEVIDQAKEIAEQRKRALLVLFYPPTTPIGDPNLDQLYTVLTETNSLSRSSPLAGLDILLQTYGGNPHAAYRLAQLIREYTEHATFLIPEYAYSAGTLMCLGGNDILYGDLAVLSPMDVSLVTTSENALHPEDLYPDELSGDANVETVAIDYFIQVARNARVEIEREFRRRRWRNSKTDIESAMLCEMTRQIGVFKIAKYYREKDITREYARLLLETRMFAGARANKAAVIEKIIRYLVLEAPAHEFPIDINLSKDIGLKTDRMTEDLSKATRALATSLSAAARDGDKTLFVVTSGQRAPFFYYQPYASAPLADAGLELVGTDTKHNGRKRAGVARTGEAKP
jgi:hypothetical protein